MASSQPDRPRSPLTQIERRVRRHMTRIVDRECTQLRTAGIRVIRLEPGAEDLEAFGFNMLDPGRRVRVFDTARRTAPGAVGRALASV
jgi:NTE family protein